MEPLGVSMLDRIVGTKKLEANGHLPLDADLITDSAQLASRGSAWEAVQAARLEQVPDAGPVGAGYQLDRVDGQACLGARFGQHPHQNLVGAVRTARAAQQHRASGVVSQAARSSRL